MMSPLARALIASVSLISCLPKAAPSAKDGATAQALAKVTISAPSGPLSPLGALTLDFSEAPEASFSSKVTLRVNGADAAFEAKVISDTAMKIHPTLAFARGANVVLAIVAATTASGKAFADAKQTLQTKANPLLLTTQRYHAPATGLMDGETRVFAFDEHGRPAAMHVYAGLTGPPDDEEIECVSTHYGGDFVESVSALGKGPDGVWCTADDMPMGMYDWTRKTDASEATYRAAAPGDDGVWRTDDDVSGSVKVSRIVEGSPMSCAWSGSGTDESLAHPQMCECAVFIEARQWQFIPSDGISCAAETARETYYCETSKTPQKTTETCRTAAVPGQANANDIVSSVRTSAYDAFGQLLSSTSDDRLPDGAPYDARGDIYEYDPEGNLQHSRSINSGPDRVLGTDDDWIQTQSTYDVAR